MIPLVAKAGVRANLGPWGTFGCAGGCTCPAGGTCGAGGARGVPDPRCGVDVPLLLVTAISLFLNY